MKFWTRQCILHVVNAAENNEFADAVVFQLLAQSMLLRGVNRVGITLSVR